MRKAKLEVLGLEVPLGLFNVYHDDGFVDSITDHLAKLFERYGYGKVLINDLSSGKTLGMYKPMCGRFKVRHHYIFYLDTGFSPLNTFIRGEEETHLVDDLNCLDLLAEKILEEQRVRIDFEAWEKGSEVRAKFGGIYALFAHNMHPEMLNGRFKNDNFEIAWRIYEGSRLPERKIFS